MNFFRRRKKSPANHADDTVPGEASANASTDREGAAATSRNHEGSNMSETINAPNQATADDGIAPIDLTTSGSTDEASPGVARPMPGARPPAELRADIITVLKTVYDPEIPVDIYELGLIYEVEVEPTGDVEVIMTLTTPMCPVAETLPPEVEAKVRDVPGVKHVQLELVWEPPWSMDMMSEAARLELNL